MFVNSFCLQKLGLRRVMKIDFKTDKWKSDRALEKIDCSYSEMHIFGCVRNDFQSLSHNAV